MHKYIEYLSWYYYKLYNFYGNKCCICCTLYNILHTALWGKIVKNLTFSARVHMCRVRQTSCVTSSTQRSIAQQVQDTLMASQLHQDSKQNPKISCVVFGYFEFVYYFLSTHLKSYFGFSFNIRISCIYLFQINKWSFFRLAPHI